jgi:hypothetical protein
MTRGRKVIAIVAAGLAVAATVVIVIVVLGDPAKTSDRSSTRTYLSARYSYEHASEAALSKGRAVVDGLVANIRAECSNALRNAPSEPRIVQEKYQEGGAIRFNTRMLLLQEATAGIEGALRGSRTAATNSFVDRVKRLRWSDRQLTTLIHSFADVEEARLQGHVPSLCQDVNAWASSGFRYMPANAERGEPNVEEPHQKLANALTALGCEAAYPEHAISQLLKPYQGTDKELTSSQVEQLEAKVSAEEYAIMGDAISQIEHALGLPREESSRKVLTLRRTSHHHALPTQACQKVQSRKAFSLPASSPLPG